MFRFPISLPFHFVIQSKGTSKFRVAWVNVWFIYVSVLLSCIFYFIQKIWLTVFSMTLLDSMTGWNHQPENSRWWRGSTGALGFALAFALPLALGAALDLGAFSLASLGSLGGKPSTAAWEWKKNVQKWKKRWYVIGYHEISWHIMRYHFAIMTLSAISCNCWQFWSWCNGSSSRI